MIVPRFDIPAPPFTHALQGDDLALKYKPVAEEEGEQGWEEVYTMSLQHCMHGPGCTMTNCSVRLKLCTAQSSFMHSCFCSLHTEYEPWSDAVWAHKTLMNV